MLSPYHGRRGCGYDYLDVSTVSRGLSIIILTGVLSAEAPQRTTDRAASPARFAVLRTPWGDPDLQGIWPSDHLVDVPLERPASFGTRAELTDVEFAAAQARANSDISPVTAPPPHWLERGKASRLASLVVDPPDGRLPPMTEDVPAAPSSGGRRLPSWDGDSLVVETTNFNGKTGSYGRNGNGNLTTEALRLVERFTLLDANTLQYEVTVTDPRTWTRPWTVRFPLLRDDGYQTFEYGCHEGYYAMTNSLRGARARER